MADDTQKPDRLPGGEPTPETGATVAAHDPDKPRGERQDGAGIAAPRVERSDAVAPGTTADARGGPRQGHGGDDPFTEHRGDPARIGTGAAKGSGAGETEEPDIASKSGGGDIG